MSRQRSLGAYYTVGNPFSHAPFREWLAQVPAGASLVEPFCGDGAIPRLLEKAGFESLPWTRFDVDPEVQGALHQDTLLSFPAGFDVVVTNPPYLSHHFAKRKGVEVDRALFHGYSSLYQAAIYLALSRSPWVAMIVPESFLTSGLFRDRLQYVISLPYPMFDDTEMPTCLALWGPDVSADFEVYSADERVGLFSDAAQPLSLTECASRVTFNVASGQLGLRAVDRSTGPTIRFCDPSDIPLESVKVSARLMSRIRLDVKEDQVPLVRERANTILSAWREETHDVLLTAFKGTRTDDRFRRRLDFANARAVLSQAICEVRGCDHSGDVLDLWGSAS